MKFSVEYIGNFTNATTRDTWLSNVAQLLGISYDTTNKVLYKGSNTDNGWFVGTDAGYVDIKPWVNGANAESAQDGYSMRKANSNTNYYLIWKANTDGDVMFGFVPNLTDRCFVDLIIAKGKKVNDNSDAYGYYTWRDGATYRAHCSETASDNHIYIFSINYQKSAIYAQIISPQIVFDSDRVFIPNKLYIPILAPRYSSEYTIISMSNDTYASSTPYQADANNQRFLVKQ